MEKTINIFGDSITYGGYVEGISWVDQLRNYLEENPNDYFEVYNLGITGDTSGGVLKRFTVENEARIPDIIMIAIGINDSKYINTKGNPFVPFEEFGNNLLSVVEQAKLFTENIVFVGLTKVDEARTMGNCEWDTNEYFDNENVEIYNAKIKEICEKNNLFFIEMLDLLENKDLKDGLHPNSVGHEKMFLRIRDFLVENEII